MASKNLVTQDWISCSLKTLSGHCLYWPQSNILERRRWSMWGPGNCFAVIVVLTLPLKGPKDKERNGEGRRGKEGWTIGQGAETSVVRTAHPLCSAMCSPKSPLLFQFTCLIISTLVSANYFSPYFTEETEATRWDQPQIAIHFYVKTWLISDEMSPFQV